jgi:hypothetical protein
VALSVSLANPGESLMTSFAIEQAIFGREGSAEPVPWGRSEGFREDWLPEAKAMILSFGNRPAGVACPDAVFARPFDLDQVAVVQVADQPSDFLGFHFLVMPRWTYEKFLGDPFHLAAKFPAPWGERRTLPTHTWPCVPLPPRTVEEVRQVLKSVKVHALAGNVDPKSKDFERTTENSESPALLGAAQILVEGGKVVFERAQPDTPFLQGLWTLLPISTRPFLWPASFAFSNQLGFDALVVPQARGPEYEGYLNEEQAIEYPEGYYELNLQIAAEAGNQDELDALLNRRNPKQVWQWALMVLILAIGFLFLRQIDFTPDPPPPPADLHLRAAAAAGVVAVTDPWTALGIMHLGNQMWGHR